ncbi:amidase family protein [Aquimarina addita]|uniref:Amidase family protein n=1 Tax=Aquimarina addita TaxID=870485 RepID=A0ABP6UQ83_9FLAO
MKSILSIVSIIVIFISCKRDKEVKAIEEVRVLQPEVVWKAYDETTDLEATQNLEKKRMHLKLINSRIRDKNDIWNHLNEELKYFSEEDHMRMKALILEKDIPSIQQSIQEGKLSYEDLVKFYIYRIRKFESDNNLSLNSVISLNPKVIAQARHLDSLGPSGVDINSIYGMPILVKDNIGVKDMPTTAGAVVFKDNITENAFIISKLKDKNALILGKSNLSEWAYFFCEGCPVGYSAIGGQTLNPYGRLIFETGGSSSGSGVAVAANFCVAAIGTETSGSILSPSSQNSVVGLKPTIGVLSRSGIVPISSTLDTPGPMTKSSMDAAILFSAMLGKDVMDPSSILMGGDFISATTQGTITKMKFGVIKELLVDSLYANAVEQIKNNGGVIIEISPKDEELSGFLQVLNFDMKRDLPKYIKKYANTIKEIKTVEDIVSYNLLDTINRMPYGQGLLEGIVKDETSLREMVQIKEDLQTKARAYFDTSMKQYNLHAILSINNYHAGYAAMAKYPALTVPMGYDTDGEPKGLTFITKPFSEALLLKLGYAYEQISNKRKAPEKYR